MFLTSSLPPDTVLWGTRAFWKMTINSWRSYARWEEINLLSPKKGRAFSTAKLFTLPLSKKFLVEMILKRRD